MPPALVFKLLKLKYVHELQNRGMHRIDFVHVMTKKTERSKSGRQTLNASKYHFPKKDSKRNSGRGFCLRRLLHPLHITPSCYRKAYVKKTMTAVERDQHALDIISVILTVKSRNVFKYNIVGVEAMVRDESEKDRAQSIRNAFVAECNAPQTNSATLSPGGVKGAFKFMLAL